MDINEIQLITNISILLGISLVIKICLSLLRLEFLHSGQNALTLFILPQATYVVTTAISGNLALSLGLVGALSIVRFRNPVRSSMELAVYFMTISAGIVATVNIKLSLAIGCIFIALTIFSFLAKKIIPNSWTFKTQLATEPHVLGHHIVEIVSNAALDAQLGGFKIMSKLVQKNGSLISFHYTVDASDQNAAISLTDKISKSDATTSARYQYSRTEPLEIS